MRQCPACAEPLEVSRCIEAGHIFKLGTRYAEAMNATVLDADGVQRPLVMGSYGIGIERAVAALAETHHDEKGLLWPVDVAPFQDSHHGREPRGHHFDCRCRRGIHLP